MSPRTLRLLFLLYLSSSLFVLANSKKHKIRKLFRLQNDQPKVPRPGPEPQTRVKRAQGPITELYNCIKILFASPKCWNFENNRLAYARYMNQRKMRQAEERELREKLAHKILPPAATTPASLMSRLSRLPMAVMSRMPPMNTQAIMARVPPQVLQKVNATTTVIVANIPPQVLQTIEGARGTVMQAAGSVMAFGQRMQGAFMEGFNSGKGGQLMGRFGGMMGRGPRPPPAPRPGPMPQRSKPSSHPKPSQLMQMVAGLLPEREQIMAVGQRIVQIVSSNPKVNDLITRVAAMMPPPPPPQPKIP